MIILLQPIATVFSALVRGEVDCSMATYTWLENFSKENPYKIYPDSDLEDFHVENYDKGAESDTGTLNNNAFDDEPLMNIDNMMEGSLLEKGPKGTYICPIFDAYRHRYLSLL